jgi:type VI secretion system protein ImpK
MGSAGVAGDANPLTSLFGRAHQAFCAARDDVRRQFGPAPASSPAAADDAAQAMSDKLRDIAVELERDANLYLTAAEPSQARAVRYAFAAVVDEVLLNSDWPGAAAWSNHLLETMSFPTQLAGARLPLLSAAVTREPRSRYSVELAGLYLDCFNLGFEGNLRKVANGKAELDKLRNALFSYVYQGQARIGQSDYRLAEPPAQYVLKTEPRARRLGQRVRWYAVPLAALALPLLVSGILWLLVRRSIIDDIAAVLRQ